MKACVAIVDSAHARLFTYDDTGDQGPTLGSERMLESAGRTEHGMFTDHQGMKPGVVGTGGQPGASHRGGHGSADDHRTGHLAELDARFAKQIVEDLATCVRDQVASNIIIVASPKMLGTLRAHVGPLVRAGAALTEVDENMTNLSVSQIQEKLARLDIVRPRTRPAMSRTSGASAR
jgi:protein required for attachment to host cells